MKRNIGASDRWFRFFIGTGLIVTSLITKSSITGLFGIFTLYEAIAGWCIFYQLIGRNTCPIGKTSKREKVNYKSYYIAGLAVLLTAIILNFFSAILGWITWYRLLNDLGQRDFSLTLKEISLDNWLFLLILYPLSLSYSAIWTFKKLERPVIE